MSQSGTRKRVHRRDGSQRIAADEGRLAGSREVQRSHRRRNQALRSGDRARPRVVGMGAAPVVEITEAQRAAATEREQAETGQLREAWATFMSSPGPRMASYGLRSTLCAGGPHEKPTAGRVADFRGFAACPSTVKSGEYRSAPQRSLNRFCRITAASRFRCPFRKCATSRRAS